MDKEKKELAEEAVIEEEAEKAAEETVEKASEEAAEKVSEEAAEEAAEEISEEAAEEMQAEPAEDNTLQDEETPVRVSSKRIKKAERREAKAARKAANKIEEKKTRPNNLLIAILIFGVVIAMFAFVLGYNYFSKPATIEKYIKDNGGEEAYGSMMLDAYTTANITAEGNSMNIEITAASDDDAVSEQIRDYYGGDDGKEQLEYLAAYFLTGMKPQTRAFSADVKATVKLNDEELNAVEMTYKEAKDLMEEEEEEAEEAAEDTADEESDDTEDAEDASEDTADAADSETDTEDTDNDD